MAEKRNFKYLQGKYIPKHPEKYKGNPNAIFFRSFWEYHLFRWLDSSSKVLEWGSETVVVPYKSPKTGRYHRYFVDIYAKIIDKDNVPRKYLIEVKPYKETIPPKTMRDTPKYRQRLMNYYVNLAKWKAAEEEAEKKGMKFVVITEKELYGK
ncbi:MAG: head completion protein [Patescibacteria group bacterium]|nr:head completion protein [Patescibacteria group bacterium]